MRKILLALLLVLLLPTYANATTYYACSNANLDAANLFDDDAGCASAEFEYAGALPAAGDVIEANTYTITINTNPGPNGAVTLQNTAGGGFTVATNATPMTITANGKAIGAALLTITGDANANPALNISGDTTWTGGNGSAEYAIADTHTVGTVVFGSAGHPVAVVGGSNQTAYGYYTATVSPTTGYVTATGSAAIGWYSSGAVAHSFLAGSSCVGSDSSTYASGCASYSTNAAAYISITGGNIINGTKATGAIGVIRWIPTSPSSDVTGNYVKFDGGGTAVYVGTNTDDATKALTTFYYIDPTDGTSDQGSASSSGGGAWGW